MAAIGPKVIAYNVPSRTGVSLTAETVAELSQIKNLVALKEASADLALCGQMLLSAAQDFNILSGDDFRYGIEDRPELFEAISAALQDGVFCNRELGTILIEAV